MKLDHYNLQFMNLRDNDCTEDATHLKCVVIHLANPLNIVVETDEFKLTKDSITIPNALPLTDSLSSYICYVIPNTLSSSRIIEFLNIVLSKVDTDGSKWFAPAPRPIVIKTVVSDT